MPSNFFCRGFSNDEARHFSAMASAASSPRAGSSTSTSASYLAKGKSYSNFKSFKTSCCAALPSLTPNIGQIANQSHSVIVNGKEETFWMYTLRCGLGDANAEGRVNRCSFFVTARGVGEDRETARYTITKTCGNHSEHVRLLFLPLLHLLTHNTAGTCEKHLNEEQIEEEGTATQKPREAD